MNHRLGPYAGAMMRMDVVRRSTRNGVAAERAEELQHSCFSAAGSPVKVGLASPVQRILALWDRDQVGVVQATGVATQLFCDDPFVVVNPQTRTVSPATAFTPQIAPHTGGNLGGELARYDFTGSGVHWIVDADR